MLSLFGIFNVLVFLVGNLSCVQYAQLPDEDLHKFVSVGVPLSDVQYVPADLVPLLSSESLRIQGDKVLRKEATEQLYQLSLAFYEVFKKPLVVVSAYRSYQYQKNQIAESCKQTRYCAREGESEHQLGLAVDVFEATNEEQFLEKYSEVYEWLVANAWKRGFHQSYQKGKNVDGYAIEPWHWRYLQVDLAKVLWEK
jgi:D-alanyl-D-alanine carboxypeptidase